MAEDYAGDGASILRRSALLLRNTRDLIRARLSRRGLELCYFLASNRGGTDVQAKGDFRWLLLRLKRLRWRIALGLLCVSLAGIAAAIDPMLMRSLIDSALPQRNLRWALELVGGIGLCYFGRSALYAMGSLVNFSIAQHCVRDLRIALLDQMNRLSADYHEQTPTGEKLTRIEHDVDEIANLGADTANQSVRAVLFFVLNLAMMARLNLPMTLTVLPLMPLFAIIQRRFSVLLRARADEARSEVGVATSVLNEYLAAVPQIQLLCAEEVSAQRARSVWDGMLKLHRRADRVENACAIGIERHQAANGQSAGKHFRAAEGENNQDHRDQNGTDRHVPVVVVPLDQLVVAEHLSVRRVDRNDRIRIEVVARPPFAVEVWRRIARGHVQHAVGFIEGERCPERTAGDRILGIRPRRTRRPVIPHSQL